jgi:hypothetical protein
VLLVADLCDREAGLISPATPEGIILFCMEWSQKVIDELNAALKEATPCGLSYDSEHREARLLIESNSLPENGSMDSDPRRVLIMSAISTLEVWLWPDRDQEEKLGMAVSLQSLDELERSFQSLGWTDFMYGWCFIDAVEPKSRIPGPPSLRIEASRESAPHNLRWLRNCGHVQFLLAGLIEFAELDVRRADDTPVGAQRFAGDGARWWRAFYAHDERINVDAQRQHSKSAPHWRGEGSTRTLSG